MRDVTVRLIRIRIRERNSEPGAGRDVATDLAAALPAHVASMLSEGARGDAANVPALSVRVAPTATADVMAAAVARALGQRLRGRDRNDAS
ncbi:MAG: hypothetical protein ABJC63_01140 [Gemmatimonadales bacterium]